MAKPDRVVREMLQVLKEENSSLKAEVYSYERKIRRGDSITRFNQIYQSQLDEALIATRILAAAVNPNTQEGKAARAEARKVLEAAGIRPPGTLGSSRQRKARKKRRVDSKPTS